MRDRAQAITEVTDAVCVEYLDEEYGQIARLLVARLARKRPSPLAKARPWPPACVRCSIVTSHRTLW